MENQPVKPATDLLASNESQNRFDFDSGLYLNRTSLHTRIAAVVREHQQGQEWGIPQDECECGWLSRTDEIDYADHLADAVIRELDDQFLDFALWLSVELTGKRMIRVDAQSCLTDWKKGAEPMTDTLRGLVEHPFCCLCHKRFEAGDYAQGRPNDSPPSWWHRNCVNPKGLPTRLDAPQ